MPVSTWAKDGLNYNLKGENGQQQQGEQSAQGAGDGFEEELQEAADGVVAAHELGVLTNGRVDVRA